MKLEGLTIPGDNDLDTTSLIQLSGTGTAFDQVYFPDSITRRLSFDGGYEMTIEAKNHAPDSTVTL
jgi:phage protein D